MLEKKEKVYLSVLIVSAILLIFTAIYISNRCPDCDKTYSKNPNQSIVVYRIG
jgi:cell division protein FtsL